MLESPRTEAIDLDLLSLLTSQLADKETLSKIGGTVGASPSQAKKVAELGLPALLQALSRNAGSEQGAQSLAKALDQHSQDDVDDLLGFFNKVDRNDGDKILGHILADRKTNVQSAVAKQSGLDVNQVSGLLTQFAPLLLGLLGKQKQQQNVGADGLAGMLSSLTGGTGNNQDSGLMSMASKLLDADGDGNIMDDIGGLLGGFFGKR